MASKEVPQLDAAGAITGDEEIHVVQDGNSRRKTLTEIFAAIGYSDEKARDALGAALVAGANITITVNDAGDEITIAAAGGAAYTDEQARDAIAAALVAGNGITITVDDAANTITITGKKWFGAAPTLADLPTVVSVGTVVSSSAVDDADLGLSIVAKITTADSLFARMRAAPAFPFTVTAHFECMCGVTNFNPLAALVLRASTTGKKVLYGNALASNRLLLRGSTGTVFNANGQDKTLTMRASGWWVRAVVTSDTVIDYYVSPDGKNWILFSASGTSLQCPALDQIGIGVGTYAAAADEGIINCDYFHVA